LIDGIFVNGSARAIGRLGTAVRKLQTGFVSHYAFVMIIGAFALVSIWLFG